MLAIGSQDSTIYIMLLPNDAGSNQGDETSGDDNELVKLTGHTAGISHIDWANDNYSLRSNSIDYELLYWKINNVNGKEGKSPS